MDRVLRIIFLVVTLGLLTTACRQAKYVPEGKYLHKENSIYFVEHDSTGTQVETEDPDISATELDYLIKPQPNSGFKLWVYNRIDTVRYNKQVKKKTEKNRLKNQKRQNKVDKVNKRRIDKARSKGDSTYLPKQFEPKELKLGRRHSLRTKFGEAPVLFDSALVEKSKDQMKIYLKKEGYYYAKIKDTIYFKEKKKKSFVDYNVDAGKPYIITSICYDSSGNQQLLNEYSNKYTKKEGSKIEIGNRLIESDLQEEREAFSKYCRDNAFFGLAASYVNFAVDTTRGDYEAHIIVFTKKKAQPHPDYPDSTVFLRHQTHRVRQVRFFLYNTDTNSFVNGFSNYIKRCQELGKYGYSETTGQATYKDSTGNWFLLDTIEIENVGLFFYNDVPYLNPKLLNHQNFMEIYVPGDKERNFYYKDYYLPRTYQALANLGVFSTISPNVYINPQKPFSNEVHVDYHLYPMDKQSFVLEPKATNTNSALGIFSTIQYTNINLNKGAQKFKFSISGGFESQPLIVTNAAVDEGFFNTWEIEPKLGLEFPQLVPFHLLFDDLSKRMFPTTKVEIKYNYQNRSEFRRNIASFIWTWKWVQDKLQDWSVNPFYFDYVRVNKEDFFQERLNQLNDPFLIDSYSDHFTTLVGLTYHYNNERSDRRKQKRGENNNPRKGRHKHDFILSVKQSGGILALTGLGTPDSTGTQLSLIGVPYTQFLKAEGQYVANQYIDEKRRLVYRAIAGIGYAYGNSQSLPYEQSFFAGGSNDIRAFPARTMAPGATQVYKDSNATTTQLGDIKLQLNLEYRFDMASIFKGAFFLDAGNIWKLNSPLADDPGLFSFQNVLAQSALGGGFGLRMDLDFLIVRLDLAFPIYNPYLEEGERWLFEEHPIYDSNFLDPDPDKEFTEDYVAPHQIRLNFGIGYPF